MLDVIIALFSLVSTWRFCVVVTGAAVAAFAVADAMPDGVLRPLGLTCILVTGAILGAIWQRSYERQLKSRRGK